MPRRVRARHGPATLKYLKTVKKMRSSYGLGFSSKWPRMSPLSKARAVIQFRQFRKRIK